MGTTAFDSLHVFAPISKGIVIVFLAREDQAFVVRYGNLIEVFQDCLLLTGADFLSSSVDRRADLLATVENNDVYYIHKDSVAESWETTRKCTSRDQTLWNTFLSVDVSTTAQIC